jgi:hypothetical protein
MSIFLGLVDGTLQQNKQKFPLFNLLDYRGLFIQHAHILMARIAI